MKDTVNANLFFSPDIAVEISPNARLADYTTFRLGGPCKALISCQTPLQLERVIKQLADDNLPFILIGSGSNLVVSDEELDCYVVRYDSPTPLIELDGTEIQVAASTKLDDLAIFAAEHGLEGLNYTSGIPGTVGGAVVGNAGAFGKQVGDVLKSVVLIDKKGCTREAGPHELGFTYRHSILKETGDIVVSAKFQLQPGDRGALLTEREEILSVRREKHPNLETHPCAGSFFRNIEPTSAAGRRQATGWFLDQAGGKKLRHGGAAIFEKHANIIVKSDGCTAQDVLELSKKMAELIKKEFNIDLVREVRFVGRFAGQKLQSIIW